MIDNYDSFSYNLYQLIGEIDPEIRVIRNDEMTVEEIRDMYPDRIILSPGPGRPEDAGIIIEAVQGAGQGNPAPGRLPRASGGVRGVRRGYHLCERADAREAVKCEIRQELPAVSGYPGEGPCAPGIILLRRTHPRIPEELRVTAVTDDGEVMAVQHREYPIYGVQFHPESIMTPDGRQMLEKFLLQSRMWCA